MPFNSQVIIDWWCVGLSSLFFLPRHSSSSSQYEYGFHPSVNINYTLRWKRLRLVLFFHQQTTTSLEKYFFHQANSSSFFRHHFSSSSTLFFRNIAKMQTTQLYNVVIPDGIKSGQQFQAALGGTIQTLTCPPNLMGGMTMQVNLSQPTAVPVASAIPIAASNVVPVLVPPPQAGVAVVVQQPPVKQAFDIGGPQDANKKDKNGFENLGPAGVGSPGYKAILIFLLYAILSGGEYALSSTSLSRILFGAFVDRGVIGNIYFPVEGNVRDEWPFWVMATFGIIAACFVIGEFVHSSSGGKNLLRAVNFTICATIMPGAWYVFSFHLV